jgi:hypothetical protein
LKQYLPFNAISKKSLSLGPYRRVKPKKRKVGTGPMVYSVGSQQFANMLGSDFDINDISMQIKKQVEYHKSAGKDVDSRNRSTDNKEITCEVVDQPESS